MSSGVRGNETAMEARIEAPWGARTPYGAGEEWPAHTDMHLADGVSEDQVERWCRSASILHSNGDAMDIAVLDGRIVGVRGRADDRVNRGRLDPKDLLFEVVQRCEGETAGQLEWLRSRMNEAAPQALVVAR
jgi:hypothetical protein